MIFLVLKKTRTLSVVLFGERRGEKRTRSVSPTGGVPQQPGTSQPELRPAEGPCGAKIERKYGQVVGMRYCISNYTKSHASFLK